MTSNGPFQNSIGVDGHLFNYLKHLNPHNEASKFFVEAAHPGDLVTDRQGLIRRLESEPPLLGWREASAE